MSFLKLSQLPYSRRWLFVKVKDCEFFAIKLDSWLVYEPDVTRLKKKTHKNKKVQKVSS